jgi:hypothetical protein
MYFLAGNAGDATKFGIMRDYSDDTAPRIQLGTAVKDFGRYEFYSPQTGCADVHGLKQALHDASFHILARGFTIVIYGPPETITRLAWEAAADLQSSLVEIWDKYEDSPYPQPLSAFKLETTFPREATLRLGEALCITECAEHRIVRLSHVRRR